MARNKRTCEQCGGTSSPHIPRQRVEGRMLCQGCASRALTTSSAKKDPKKSGAYLKPKDNQETFDFWDGDLAPNEELHPLHQPLPNSVWEKYAKHRELLGKPKIMMHDHLEEAEEKGGDSDPFPGSRGEAEQAKKGPGKQPRLPIFRRRKKGSLGKTTGAEHMQGGPELVQHLQEHHGMAPAIAHIMGGSTKKHIELHGASSDHAHDENGAVVGHGGENAHPEAPHPTSMGPKDFHNHLVQDHGWTSENAKAHVDQGLSHLMNVHKIDHEVDAQGDHLGELKHTHKGAGELPHPQGSNEMAMHLMDHHHVGDWEMEGMDEHDLHDTHDAFHESTAYSGKDKPEHTHPEGVAEKETAAPAASGDLHPPAKSMKGKQIIDHLKWEHDLPLTDIHKAFKSGGDHPTDGGVGAAQKWHDEQHAAGTPHAHGHTHAVTMSPQEMEDHLKNNHGIQGPALENVKKSWDGTPGENLAKLHDNNHAGGNHSGTEHDHGGQVVVDESGPEQLKHPSKFTNSSMYTHLLEDHGIHPDHLANATDGTFESTNPSHVVHMLHNAAHKNGQVKFEHEHEGWNGGGEIHPGHTDVAKPFWGAPPATAQKALEHLTGKKSQGGHGLSQDALDGLMKEHTGGKKLLEDSEYHEAYEKVHGGLHEQGGDDANHQHVPTIQPGVMSPEKVKKEKLKQHLKDYHDVSYAANPDLTHGELHDPEAYAYKGHPGHEHTPWDKHGPITHELPSGHSLPPAKDPQPGDFQSTKPFNPGHHDHPTNMSKADLEYHIQSHHQNWTVGKNGENPTPPTTDQFANALFDTSNVGKSHEELLQQHALHHATGETNGHTHEAGGWDNPLENSNAHYGAEPEIQTDTHPHVENDHEALAHMIKHHPNVTQEHYDDWHKGNQTGEKPTMVKFHDALHSGGKFGDGSKLPKVLDGHDHADASGPPTQISVGSHLVHDHGMDQSEVASMTPAEFKAHHEQLHLKKPEFDIGHGHEHPGGPVRDPRTILPNTHHQAMRDDDKHPAVQEWYHGTGTDYEGAPKNATELKSGHGFWGNFGGGDWNNHVGTHWSSLHEMSKNFNGGGNRVIHARLHMSNPIKYNSLNHMAHDAYERLRASGHMQDDGEFDGNHDDDNGYNHCCSGRLLEYAKGHHRNDGKFGLEAYRDSLRASGHDGIHVRNQADSPTGHWNAIPLSADQIEVTHGGCRGHHDDERDSDVSEFNHNSFDLTRGWKHPKTYRSSDYLGQKLDHLPNGAEVAKANSEKGSVPTSNKHAEGRGDSDPYAGDLDELDEDSGNNNLWCDHCDEHGDHESKNCQYSKWCSVCETHGDHEASDEHDYCDHCDEYADHGSDDCEKNPDNMKVEAYCPHCDQSHENNKHSSNCVNCGQKLPDWGKLQSQGTPVKDSQYKEDGETDGADFGHASAAKMQGHANEHELAAHLYHHHKSDVSGKEFDDKGSWNEDALKYHHQWLHQNSEKAKSLGFDVDHDHKNTFGQYNKTLTPEETHAHMMAAHCGPKQGGVGSFSLADVSKMTPEQAVEAHKKAHTADDAVHWGEKDSDGDLVPKITHTHNLEGDQASFDEAHYPEGDDLLEHLQDGKHHMGALPNHVLDSFKKNPGVADALHSQLHKNYGPSAEPGVGKYHVHTPEMLQEIVQKKAVKDHLVNDHGASPDHYMIKGKSIDDLMKTHDMEHQSSFPNFKDPDHTHFGGTNHKDPGGHTAETMKKVSEPEPEPAPTPAPEPTPAKEPDKPEEKEPEVQFPELHDTTIQSLLKDHGGGDLDMHMDYHHPDVYGNLQHSEGFWKAPGTPEFQQALKEAHEAHMKAHAEGSDHTHGGTAPKTKESSLRTLSDLFEEVAS